MVKFADVLFDRDEVAVAEFWYVAAAERGNTHAMICCGNTLEEAGDLDEAEAWYRKASDAGDSAGADALNNLLQYRSDLKTVRTLHSGSVMPAELGLFDVVHQGNLFDALFEDDVLVPATRSPDTPVPIGVIGGVEHETLTATSDQVDANEASKGEEERLDAARVAMDIEGRMARLKHLSSGDRADLRLDLVELFDLADDAADIKMMEDVVCHLERIVEYEDALPSEADEQL